MNTSSTSEFMKPTDFENGHPGPSLPDGAALGGNGNGSPGTPLDEALRVGLEHLHEAHAWRCQITMAMESLSRATQANHEHLEKIAETLAEVQAALPKETSASSPVMRDVAREEVSLGQLIRGQVAQVHNLEQVRLQTEALSRKFEELSQEILWRQVKDPWCVALARLYESVYELIGRTALSDADLEPIRQRIRSLLEDHDVQLIHPDDGAPLDPRRHQPVKQLPSTDPALQGRIATTFNVGLLHGQRLIQPARVAVFLFADTPSAKSESTSTPIQP